MVSRMCFYLLILSELHLPWFVEQPSLSLMETHPMFEYLCKRFTVYKASGLHPETGPRLMGFHI